MTSQDTTADLDDAVRTHDLRSAVDRVQTSPFVLDVLRASEDLVRVAATERGPETVATLRRLIDSEDQLAAVAAVHGLARVFDDSADALLSELLSHERAFLREHAAWVLGARLPRIDAIGRLAAGVARGGFGGFLAQRTLEQWAPHAADHVALALEGALAVNPDPTVRARLVETLGLVPGQVAARAVLERAADVAEDLVVRCAAVAALGDRRGNASAEALVRALLDEPDGPGRLRAVARLAAVDLGLVAFEPTAIEPTAIEPTAIEPTAIERPERESGLTVAQLFLHADIDRDLSRAGAGDNGGVATLLVRLGDALQHEGAVSRVITLSRGSADTAAASLVADAGELHRLAQVPLLEPPVSSSQAWPSRVAAARGIRRALLAHGPVDVIHLRMADVGSLAAAEVAEELGIPTVFSLAPDPHAVIHALDMTGALTRENFGDMDEREHYWFRARLVQRLTTRARHVVLFPRPRLREDLRELVGVDLAADPERFTVVPEGIDVGVSREARRHLVERPEAFAGLERLVAGLPARRQGLPLALSVGRLHRVKGMSTLAEAWASDRRLREWCNLVIVGGDLDDPSPEELEQLDLIAGLRTGGGLVLAGHRPNDEVAHWLAAAQHGRWPLIAPGGVYVCASLKEEFGLALLEALSAGLVVVGPAGGGPATYVEEGVTGFLVDTRSPADLGRGILSALDLAAQPPGLTARRVERAGSMVERRFTVQAMAATLAGVYADVAAPVAANR